MIRIVVERTDQPPSVRAFPKDAVVIGRADESDWSLPYPDISRQHCRFSYQGGQFFVEGLSDRSPIYVNGRRVHGLTRIGPQDVVRFGMCTARLGATEVAEEAVHAGGPRPQSTVEAVPPRNDGKVDGPQRAKRAEAAGVISEPPRTRRSDPPKAEAVSSAPPAALADSPSLPAAPPIIPTDMSAIVERALRWRELDRPSSHLLRGAYLRRGREWVRSARADLGEHGALVRQYVEISQSERRVGMRKGAFGGAIVVGAIVGGFWTAKVLAGELALPDVHGVLADASNRCNEDLLKRGGEILRHANSAPNERLGLLLSLHAYRIAEQSRCPEGAAIEKSIRDRLLEQGGRVLGVHPAAVVSTAMSPNQLYAASVDLEGGLNVWRLGQKQGPERLETHAKVQRLAWSEDSRLLIAGDESGGVTVWLVGRTESRRERELSEHRSPITSIAVSRSGELMATGDRRGEVRLWMVAGSSLGQKVGEYSGHLGTVHELVFDARGKRLYGRVGAGLSVWSLAASGQRRVGKPENLPTDHEVTTMDVNRTGDRILVGDASGQVFLWPVKGSHMGTPGLIHSGYEKIEQVAFVPQDQALIATSTKDLILVQYGVKVRADDYAKRRFKGTAGVVKQLVVDPSGSRALTVYDEGREIWNLSEIEADPVVGVGVDRQVWRTVAASSAHSQVVAGGEDGRVVVWDLRVGRGGGGAHVLTDHAQPVDAVVLSSDGSRLVSGGRDGVVRVWRVDNVAVTPDKTCELKAPIDRIAFHEGRVAVASGERLVVCDVDADHPVAKNLDGTYEVITHLAFSGDGGWLVAADRSGAVVGWQGRDLAVAKPSRREEGLSQVSALAVSRDRVAVATAETSGGSVVTWPLTASAGGRDVLDKEQPWTTVAFHPEGNLLAAGSRNSVVRVWNLASRSAGGSMTHDSPVSALAFSPSPSDEAKLAIGGDFGDVAVLDLKRGVPFHPEKRRSSVSSISFASPEVVITVAGDLVTEHYVRGKSENLVEFVGHTKPITGLAVDGRGKFAATSSMDGTVRVWPLREEELRWIVCDRVGGDLTPEEWGKYFPNEEPVRRCGSR